MYYVLGKFVQTNLARLGASIEEKTLRQTVPGQELVAFSGAPIREQCYFWRGWSKSDLAIQQVRRLNSGTKVSIGILGATGLMLDPAPAQSSGNVPSSVMRVR